MRIAIIADIHGNLPALEAVLARLDDLRPDCVVVAGDVVNGGPDSRACWERIRATGWPVLRGNHERYVYDFGTARAAPEWSGPKFGPAQWSVQQLGPAIAAELAALPATLRLPEVPGVLFVHASPRGDADSVFPHSPEEDFAERFSGAGAELIVRAHNHYAGVRTWQGGRIVTAGSVGLPLDGIVAAQFSLLEQRNGTGWDVRHVAVPYDVAAAVRRFDDSGYVEAAGPMARLFQREVETAAFQIVPFLTWLRRTGGEVTSRAALEARLREFLAR
jgi:hypothetical protein